MSARPSLVIASRNAKKRREIEELLAPHWIEVHSVTDFPDVPEVIEDGVTFADNAAKKAAQTAQHLNRWVLGEDSGLMVDALGGAPGVYSARFSGEGATDEKNNKKLLSELADVPDDKRGARYLCHAAISDPRGNIRFTVEATCRGRIIREPRGANGFGYDPYFQILEYHQTFGELSSSVKHHLSHRARAFERLIIPLVRLLQGENA
ncbi:MAG: RdgB/HAM1 family non-canonical purine NTP pyrophosphatase [Planctomycetia bacterium]|nr:RdgB/HAM1 family non-canonical purine NTP pyrophosphatase [Planctomycetia bacterium]